MLTLCLIVVMFLILAAVLIVFTGLIGILPAIIVVVALIALDWAVIKKIFGIGKKKN